jgi:hypothetical protein
VLINPGLYTDLAGAGLLALTVASQLWFKPAIAAAPIISAVRPEGD